VRPGETCADLLKRALTHDTRSDMALRDGNFTLYGQEREKLRQVLEAMTKAPGCTSPATSGR